MSWSFWLICIPTACYALAAIVYVSKGNWPLAVTYFGYSFANIGLLAMDLRAQ